MTLTDPSFDLHCHVDLYPNPTALVRECDTERIRTLAVTTTPKAWLGNCRLVEHSSHVRPALGLHPQLVAERAHELALFEQHISGARFVGEVGLDGGPRHYRSLQQQEKVFARILCLCAEQGRKVLTVHSTRAVRRVLELIELHVRPGQARVVLHWFTGTLADAKRASDLGCFFSVNQAMVDNPRARALVAGIPLDRLLTETDGPFVQHGDRPARPTDIPGIVAGLAEVRGVAPADMRRVVTANLRVLMSSWD